MLNQYATTLREFHACLKRKHAPAFVPEFEPKNGDESATILFLFEKPGPMTDPNKKKGKKGSGKISQYNDDPTARATKRFLEEAGIDQKNIILWNYISSWNGTRKITTEDKKHAKDETEQLLAILQNLKTVVLVGREAQKLAKQLDLSRYKVIRSLHPSPLVRASYPDKWKKIPDEWKMASPRAAGFKALIASAPLEGIELNRYRDFGRNIAL